MMTTELGIKIEDILRQTSSISSLVEFLRDNELFTSCEPIDEYKYGYLYRIGFKEWTKATGIDPESLPTRYTYRFTLPSTQDGHIWTDFDFEMDSYGNRYYENEGTRYVFIAIDNYDGRFNNDECVVAACSNLCVGLRNTRYIVNGSD